MTEKAIRAAAKAIHEILGGDVSWEDFPQPRKDAAIGIARAAIDAYESTSAARIERLEGALGIARFYVSDAEAFNEGEATRDLEIIDAALKGETT